jgi:photosystem II stability/assembly factor-like uncharacterized protein
MNICMMKGLNVLFFVAITGIIAASCVKGDDPIQRYDDPRNQGQGGVPILGPGWTKISIPHEGYDVFFVNDTLGFLATYGGVYRSTNGGVNWTKTGARQLNYMNLFFVNEKYGWAVSESKEIARTSDSGKTWVTSTANYDFSDVFFRDENNGYAATMQGVLKSTDGGSTWSLIANSPTEAGSIYFVDELVGYCGTIRNGYWRTADGGASFSRVTGLPSRIFNTQFFTGADAQKGISIGEDGNLNKTTDNGNTWTKGPKFPTTYFDFHFKDFDNGFVMTINNVYKVEGSTATKVLYRPAGNNVQFTECHFNNDCTRGWVVFNGGELYRYVKP